jgi:hypothetical protein
MMSNDGNRGTTAAPRTNGDGQRMKDGTTGTMKAVAQALLL